MFEGCQRGALPIINFSYPTRIFNDATGAKAADNKVEKAQSILYIAIVMIKSYLCRVELSISASCPIL